MSIQQIEKAAAHELAQPSESSLRNLVLTDPVDLINSAVERRKTDPSGISYAPQQDLHVVGDYKEGQQLVITANSGDISMNEKSTIIELRQSSYSATIAQGDKTDCAILFPQSNPGDTFVYEEYPDNHPSAGYNARQLELVKEGYRSIGIALAEETYPVASMTDFLKYEKPSTFAPHVLSPRVLGENDWQAHLHMGVYTKTGIQDMCKKTNIPTPPTLNYAYDGDSTRAYEAFVQEFPDYEELVISMQSGCSGEGVFFLKKDYETIRAQLFHSFEAGEMVSVQGRIPKEYILNSPCFRAYIGDNIIIPTGVTIQRLVNGKYSGNIWYNGIEKDLQEMAPDYFDISMRTLEMLRSYGVRGKINNDTMLISSLGKSQYNLQANTVHRETNVRPAFSEPFGRQIRDGVINNLPIAQIQTNFGVSISDTMYNSDNFLHVLNTYGTANTKIFLGLRYPSSYKAEPGRSYVVFAANDQVSRQELDEIHHNTLQLIGKYQ